MTDTTQSAETPKRPTALSAMRLAELQELAASMGIPTERKRKGDLVAEIRQARVEAGSAQSAGKGSSSTQRGEQSAEQERAEAPATEQPSHDQPSHDQPSTEQPAAEQDTEDRGQASGGDAEDGARRESEGRTRRGRRGGRTRGGEEGAQPDACGIEVQHLAEPPNADRSIGRTI